MSTLSVSQQWQQSRRQSFDIPFGGLITSSVLLFCLLTSEQMWHWFVIPTFVCGLLLVAPAVRWFKGKYDLFDPLGIIGVYGWYFFFLAPLYFVYADSGMRYVVPPPDWRPWVGYVGIINLAGLSLFFTALHLGSRLKLPAGQWQVEPRRLWPLFIIFGGIALAAQLYYFQISGGIGGILSRTAEIRTQGRLDFRGTGLYELAGKSLPLILLMFLSLRRLIRRRAPASRPTIAALLFLLIGIQFLFAGLEGSRSATVFSLFWFAGVFHYFWRRLTKSDVLAGLLLVLAFMYFYGFFKSGGSEAIVRITTGASLSALEADTGRTVESLLIGDLSRVYIQSYQIYRLQNATDYTLRHGETYAMAIAMRVPTWIWAGRPPDDAKVVAGTDLAYGTGVYTPGNRFRNAPWVYGLAGEAMLNFGVWFAALPFAIWGLLVGIYRRYTAAWPRDDTRWLVAPYLTMVLVMFMSNDLDLTFGGLIVRLAFPLLFVVLLSRRLQSKS